MEEKKVIYMFDDNLQELRAYKARIEKSLPAKIKDKLSIVAEAPLKDMTQYVKLVNSPLTVCLIFDQRLKVGGKVNYTGIEIASELRVLNTKIPIYILTNFASEPGEFGLDEWTVEDIIPKGQLGDADKNKKVVSRLLRRINTYQDILSQREARYRYLLEKSMQSKLSKPEKKEIQDLGIIRNLGNHVSEIPLIEEMDASIEKIKKLKSKIKGLSKS